MANWDVIVIGLGGVGSSTAYHLARQGARVLGIDQYPPAHDQGSSHGATRVIRQAYFEDPAYVPLLKRAYELWGDLSQQVGKQLYSPTGLVEIGPSDGVIVPGVLQSASQFDLDVEQMSMAEAMRRWPGLNGKSDWHAVFERNAGYLRVEACVLAHLQLAKESGAECRHGQRATAWRVVDGNVIVETQAGNEHAKHLVIAAGPWSTEVLGQIGVELSVRRKHLYWFTADQAGYSEHDGFPCFFYETPSGYYYGFPSVEEAGVKVARHTGGQAIDGPSQPHTPDATDQTLVRDFLTHNLPGVGTKLKDSAGCYYTLTPDEHFVIDSHPKHAEVSLIAGLSGHGFKFTSVLGEIAAARALSQRSTLDLSLFSINRFNSNSQP